MDFFLDTGIFLGLDPQDTHHPVVTKFFRKYRRDNFYSAKVVKKELRSYRIELEKRSRSNREIEYIRRIFQIIRVNGLDLVKEFVDYSSHEFFDALCNEFHPITDGNSRDSEILANAVIWDYQRDLENPTLVTVDDKHFYKPKNEIFEIIKRCTGQGEISLDIQCAWDMAPPPYTL